MVLVSRSNGSQPEITVSENTYILVASYMILVGITSVALNSIAAFVLLMKIKLKSGQARILFSLTLSQALSSAVSVPLTIHANFKRQWTLGDDFCAFYGFMTFSSGLASIYHLLLLSVERFLSVVHPFKSETLLRPSFLNIAIALCWCLAVGIASLPLFGWSSYVKEGIGTSCSVDLFPLSMCGISYSIFILVIGYAVPMSVIVYCNASFMKEVNRLTHFTNEHRTNAIGRQANADLVEEERRLGKQMSFLVVILIVGFNTAWLPYAVVVLIGLVRRTPFENPLISSIPSYFAKSSDIYDPVIYFVLDKKFRTSLVELFCRQKDTKLEKINEGNCQEGKKEILIGNSILEASRKAEQDNNAAQKMTHELLEGLRCEGK